MSSEHGVVRQAQGILHVIMYSGVLNKTFTVHTPFPRNLVVLGMERKGQKLVSRGIMG